MIKCTQLFKLLDDFFKGGIWSFWSHVFALFFFWGGGWKLDQFQEDLREKSGRLKNLSLQPLQIPLISRGIFFTSPKSLERWTHVCRISKTKWYGISIWNMKRNFHPEHFKKTYTPEVLTAKAPENWWSIRLLSYGEGGNFSGANC